MAKANNSPEEIRRSIKSQIGIAVGIFCMTAISVAVAILIDAPPPGNLFVAMLIAGIQAAIIGLYLMHLKGEPKLIFRVLFFAGLFLAAMLILTMLALKDPIHPQF